MPIKIALQKKQNSLSCMCSLLSRSFDTQNYHGHSEARNLELWSVYIELACLTAPEDDCAKEESTLWQITVTHKRAHKSKKQEKKNMSIAKDRIGRTDIMQ